MNARSFDTQTFHCPVGPLGHIACDISTLGLHTVRLLTRAPARRSAAARNDPRSSEILAWIVEYLAGRTTQFPLPLCWAQTTPFQRSVWQAMAAIPFGETRSYQQIAQSIGRPSAARAVGQACGANPFPLVIPCHRVVAHNSIGGFSSPMVWKTRLLAYEASLHRAAA